MHIYTALKITPPLKCIGCCIADALNLRRAVRRLKRLSRWELLLDDISRPLNFYYFIETFPRMLCMYVYVLRFVTLTVRRNREC